MTLDLNKIKAAALAAKAVDFTDHCAVGNYLAQVNVHNILELITRLEAAEKDAAKLKVIEQAAVIEKLSSSIRFDSYNMSLDEWKSICEVVNIAKTDSKPVLADWMREQLGDPVGNFWSNGKGVWLQDKEGFRIKGKTEPLFKLPECLK